MPKQLPKLLITGISGFLGRHFLNAPPKNWSCIGLYQQNPVFKSPFPTFALDLTDESAVSFFLDYHCPDAIIHLAALSNPNFCEKHPDLSASINVEVSARLANWCAQSGARFLFASTDLVFDGQHAPYDETYPIQPVNIYGRHKAEAEERIQVLYPQAGVARLPLMFGHPGTKLGFMANWLAQLEKGQPIKAFTDEYRTAAAAYEVLAGLLLLLEKKVSGIWHLGGVERMSRFDFAQKMARTFGHPVHLIQASRQAEVNMAAKRPADVSLNSNKAFELGYVASKTESALEAIQRQWSSPKL